MSTLSINTLQELMLDSDHENLSKYTDQYLLQALANLGQRTGLVGEGLTISELDLSETIMNLPMEIDVDGYAGMFNKTFVVGPVSYSPTDEPNLEFVLIVCDENDLDTHKAVITYKGDDSYAIIYKDADGNAVHYPTSVTDIDAESALDEPFPGGASIGETADGADEDFEEYKGIILSAMKATVMEAYGSYDAVVKDAIFEKLSTEGLYTVSANDAKINVVRSERTGKILSSANGGFIVHYTANAPETSSFITATSDDADEKYAAYEFTVCYDSDGLIENVKVNELYTFPYIKDDEWIVDGKETGIKSKGDDALSGNVSIIKYSTDGEHITFKPSYFDSEELELSDTASDFEYSFNGTNYSVGLKLPVAGGLTDKAKALLEGTLFVTVIDDSLFKAEDDETLADALSVADGTSAYTTLLIRYEDGEYKLVDTSDMSEMVGLYDRVKHVVATMLDPDKYEHGYLVFDGIKNALKNTAGDEDENLTLWPVITVDGNSIIPAYTPNVTIDANSGLVTGVSLPTGKISKTNTADGKHKFLSGDGSDYPKPANPDESVYPTIDLKEVYVANQTTFNRINVAGMGATKEAYLAYFGIDESDGVAKITIGTGDTNTAFNKSNSLEGNFNKVTYAEIGVPVVYKSGNATIAICRATATETSIDAESTPYMDSFAIPTYTVNVTNLLTGIFGPDDYNDLTDITVSCEYPLMYIAKEGSIISVFEISIS